MTKNEYKELLERYKLRSEQINKATIETIISETSEDQEKRIKKLLKPENYNNFFSYYFGKDTPIPLADCSCAWYHTAIYKELFYKNFITIFNTIFRGGAKSTHANLGYIFGLKQNQKAKFFLIVGQNEVMAKMLLQDLQVQFENNNRIIKDFGQQKNYGSWADGQFETADRCNFMSRGIDQPFRGLRQNGVRLEYVSIDDIEEEKRAKNNRLTNEYVKKITADIQAAFSTNSERIIINNNYFVQNGFIEKLALKKNIDLSKINTKKSQTVHKEFASLYLVNLTDKYYNQIKDDNFESNWQERFSKEYCKNKIKQYENDLETLSGEYYNTPINVGKRIKEEFIKYVAPHNLKDYELIINNFDLSYSSEACHKAQATVGLKNMQLTVLDVFCRQTDIDVAMDYHYTKSKEILKHNQSYVSFYDASVAQEDIYEPQWRLAANKNNCFQIPLPQKSIADKFIKIDTVLLNVLKNGILNFSENLKHNADWNIAKSQLLDFEKGGKSPVDFPDSLADVIIQFQNFANIQIINNENINKEKSKFILGKRKLGGY